MHEFETDMEHLTDALCEQQPPCVEGLSLRPMDKYVVEKVIGEGTYGIVYKAQEKATGDYVAIKKFKTAGGRTKQPSQCVAFGYLINMTHWLLCAQ